jgi:hypothetical protein
VLLYFFYFEKTAMTDTYQFTLPSAGAPPTLATPSFITKASDTLVASDVYKASGTILNSFQDVVKDIKAVLPTLLQGGAAIAQFIPIIQSLKSGNLNIGSLVGRLSSATSSLVGVAVKGLDPSTQSMILSATSEASKIAVSVGGVTQVLTGTNFSSIAGIGNAVNAIAGGAKLMGVSDSGNLGATIGGIMRSSGSLGISGLYNTVTTGMTDAGQLFNAAQKSLPGIVSNSDVQSLQQMSTSIPAGLTSSFSPTLVSDFSSSFTRTTALAQNPSPSQNGPILTSVLSAFNAVKSGWNSAPQATVPATSQFGLGNVSNLSAITNGSPAFQSVLTTGVYNMPTDCKEYALAAAYGPTDVSSQLSSQFPNTVFTTV